MAAHQDEHLVENALRMALQQRRPQAGLLHHSDRGSQYTSQHYQVIPNHCIEVQTSPDERPSVPAWFAEVVILSQHLATKGLLKTFTHQVRLVRGRFGSYEPIDFLALLLGHAISGERTLSAFFKRVAPFGAAFMALFGGADLPHRTTLSRFLASVDLSCLEAFRKLFEQHSFAEGWTSETIGGIWDRQGRHYVVFDVDATRQRALPCDPTLPSPQRRLNEVCAPGFRQGVQRRVCPQESGL